MAGSSASLPRQGFPEEAISADEGCGKPEEEHWRPDEQEAREQSKDGKGEEATPEAVGSAVPLVSNLGFWHPKACRSLHDESP